MRRVFYTDNNPDRKQLQQELLMRMRALRSRIAPDVLARAQASLSGISFDAQQKPCEEDIDSEGNIRIDQKKNLQTVMQFLALNPDNTKVHKEISLWLTEDNSR
ncbi:MAG: hypothetical protein H6868_05880 [Rhodospirillales bacterium]|nr:hypothetical protein [Rhodospirillales bacterium]